MKPQSPIHTHLIARLDQPQSSLGSQMCGQHHIGLTTGDLILASNDGVRDDCDEAVDVSAEVDLDHVALLDNDIGVAAQWRKVADTVVHRDATRKGNS